MLGKTLEDSDRWIMVVSSYIQGYSQLLCQAWRLPKSSPVNTGNVVQARRQGDSRGQPSSQEFPVRSAAEAFVENNLSANAAQRKPKKVIPVAVR